MTVENDTTPASPNVVPDMERLPEAMLGGKEAPEDLEEEDFLWSRFMPRDVAFMNLPLLDRLVHRPYHAVTLLGPLDLRRLVRDHAKHLFRSETSINRRGKPFIDRVLLVMADRVFGFVDENGLKLYAPTTEAAAAAARDFRQYVKPAREARPHFFVVSITGEGAIAESVVVKRAAPVTGEDVALHYGAGFPEWEQAWLGNVRKRPSGVTIFHGPPGTGKTSFLRGLMSRLLGEAVFFYVPLSEAEMLSSPKFVGFWIGETSRHKGKTKFAILEDAEELLCPCDSGSREKVSNLLNVGDGLLGDHLRLHVLATTNVPINQLDPAIIRPGRLAGARGFRRLSRTEAERLATVKGLALPEAEDFSLAELYCGAGRRSVVRDGAEDRLRLNPAHRDLATPPTPMIHPGSMKAFLREQGLLVNRCWPNRRRALAHRLREVGFDVRRMVRRGPERVRWEVDVWVDYRDQWPPPVAVFRERMSRALRAVGCRSAKSKIQVRFIGFRLKLSFPWPDEKDKA